MMVQVQHALIFKGFKDSSKLRIALLFVIGCVFNMNRRGKP